jgi:hypothetical protein
MAIHMSMFAGGLSLGAAGSRPRGTRDPQRGARSPRALARRPMLPGFFLSLDAFVNLNFAPWMPTPREKDMMMLRAQS